MKKEELQKEASTDCLNISIEDVAASSLYEDSFKIEKPFRNAKNWVFANISPKLPTWGVVDAEQGEYVSANIGFFIKQSKAKICALKQPLLKTVYDRKIGNLSLSLHDGDAKKTLTAFQAKIIGLGFDANISIEDIKEEDGESELVARIRMQRWMFEENKYILDQYEKDCRISGSEQELIGLVKVLNELRGARAEDPDGKLVKTAEKIIITYIEESNTLRVVPTLIKDVSIHKDPKEHILNLGGNSIVFKGEMSKDMQMLDYIFSRPKEDWGEPVDMGDIYNNLFQQDTEPAFGCLNEKQQNNIVKRIQEYAKMTNRKVAPLIGKPNEQLLITSFSERNVVINKGILRV